MAPRFKITFENNEIIESIIHLCNFMFAPGLLEILSTSIPPTLEYIKSLPNVCAKDVGWDI